MGFELPDPNKPLSRRNNRKIAFDAACRKMLFEIAKRHGLELEEEAEYGNRKYLEKQDFILAKQKEQLAAQQSKLDELTLKVSDMENLLEDVSAAAYDKAVEVVTDVVRTETRKEDMVCGIPVPPTNSCSRTVTSSRCRATQVMQRHLS